MNPAKGNRDIGHRASGIAEWPQLDWGLQCPMTDARFHDSQPVHGQ